MKLDYFVTHVGRSLYYKVFSSLTLNLYLPSLPLHLYLPFSPHSIAPSLLPSLYYPYQSTAPSLPPSLFPLPSLPLFCSLRCFTSLFPC